MTNLEIEIQAFANEWNAEIKDTGGILTVELQRQYASTPRMSFVIYRDTGKCRIENELLPDFSHRFDDLRTATAVYIDWLHHGDMKRAMKDAGVTT